MIGRVITLASGSRTGAIRMEDGTRIAFAATAVLGENEALAIGHRVSFDVERGRSIHTAVRVFRELVASAEATRKLDALPDLRYSGFSQAENVRTYRFDAVKPEGTARYGVTLDVRLLLKHHIGVQEAPALCLRKLTADLKASPDARPHQVGDEDLLEFASSRAAATERKKTKHSFAGRRGLPPPGPLHRAPEE